MFSSRCHAAQYYTNTYIVSVSIETEPILVLMLSSFLLLLVAPPWSSLTRAASQFLTAEMCLKNDPGFVPKITLHNAC